MGWDAGAYSRMHSCGEGVGVGEGYCGGVEGVGHYTTTQVTGINKNGNTQWSIMHGRREARRGVSCPARDNNVLG